MPAIVPHLVGFRPECSVVAVGLGPDRRTVRVTMRLDIPAPEDRSSELVHEMWESCIGALRSVAAHDVILLVYPDAAEDPWRDDDLARDLPLRDLVADIGAVLDDAGLYAVDALCVVADRWRSYWCSDLRCCPLEGSGIDPDEALLATATFVEQGSAPLDSRAELVASLESRPAQDPVRVRVAALMASSPPMPDDLVADVDDYICAVARWGDDPSDCDELERLAARAVGICAYVRSRDLLLRALTAHGDRDLLVHTRTVLSESVRCVALDQLAPVATVLAVCAWVSGAGATARVALDRAFDSDPAYSLAGLVSAALDAGTPPWTWAAMMADITVEEILASGSPRGGASGTPVAAAVAAELRSRRRDRALEDDDLVEEGDWSDDWDDVLDDGDDLDDDADDDGTDAPGHDASADSDDVRTHGVTSRSDDDLAASDPATGV